MTHKIFMHVAFWNWGQKSKNFGKDVGPRSTRYWSGSPKFQGCIKSTVLAIKSRTARTGRLVEKSEHPWRVVENEKNHIWESYYQTNVFCKVEKNGKLWLSINVQVSPLRIITKITRRLKTIIVIRNNRSKYPYKYLERLSWMSGLSSPT